MATVAPPSPSPQQIQRELVARLRTALAPAWTLEVLAPSARDPTMAHAAHHHPQILHGLLHNPALAAPLPLMMRIITRTVEPREVPALVADRARDRGLSDRTVLVVGARFLSPRTRALLAFANLNAVDTTGHLSLRIEQPGLYLWIEREGARHDPWPEPQLQQTLRGPAAGRVVRALCDVRPPYGIRELAALAATPPGTVSRILGLLDREALVQRAARGAYQGTIEHVDWPELLRRWTQDYAFARANRVGTYLEPHGLEMLFANLRTWPTGSSPLSATPSAPSDSTQSAENSSPGPYALTGSFAGVRYAPVTAPRLAALYVSDPEQAADMLGLRPAERGANVVLAEPFDPVVFARTMRGEDGLAYAAPTQVAADLLTGPGRQPQEAEALLTWMEEHLDAWRL